MSTPFSWEEAYKRTWEETKTTSSREKSASRVIKDYKPFKRGLIRHFHIVVDHSEKIDSDGYLPNFRYNIIRALDAFLQKFYQENPISIISFSTVNSRDAKEYVLADNKFDISVLLGKLGAGHFSLERALESSIAHLRRSNYIREILIITPSITIRDSNNLGKILEQLKTLNIKVHCINLCAELQLLKTLSTFTRGIHFVPMSYDHFKLLLAEFCIPTYVNSNQRMNLLTFGFPEIVYEKSFCACHLDATEYGYVCVVCSTKVCSLPMQCPMCSTQLVSLFNLSKSIYHQYPLDEFEKSDMLVCKVCDKKGSTACALCKTPFCFDCDAFVHETLNQCPFC